MMQASFLLINRNSDMGRPPRTTAYLHLIGLFVVWLEIFSQQRALSFITPRSHDI